MASITFVNGKLSQREKKAKAKAEEEAKAKTKEAKAKLNNLYDVYKPNFLSEFKCELRQNIVIHSPTFDCLQSQIEKNNDTILSKDYFENATEFTKSKIKPEFLDKATEFFMAFSDDALPPKKEHIFQKFKQQLQRLLLYANTFYPIEDLPKMALYYILLHEVIVGLIMRMNKYGDKSGLLLADYNSAKNLAILWLAIVIPDDHISDQIYNLYKEKTNEETQLLLTQYAMLLTGGRF